LFAARDFYTRRRLRASFGGPLNDQAYRRLILDALVAALEVDRIMETGTHRGTSTALFRNLAETWSIEANPRFHWFARYRFRGAPGVHLLQGDSRERLRELALRPELTAGSTLFYLDAHWGEDLPLAEELQIAAGGWEHWVALIDDFQVPGDDGYRYDSYSEDATLNADYLARRGPPGLRIWYPRLPSQLETGRRRGCAVVTTVPQVAERIDTLGELLRPA
jgi:hypothetical protein